MFTKFQVPAILFLNQNTEVDWHYETYSDGNSCLGFKNSSCIWSKGKGLGGSSSTNAMLYIRGHPNDYNNWKDSGNPGWGYEDLVPYFKKLESDLKLSEYQHPENPWYKVIELAWSELGFNVHDRNTEEPQIGTRLTKLLTRKGKRLNTAKLYLNEYKNLNVMKGSKVLKALIDPVTKIATGIKLRHQSGVVMDIAVTKEVILSAGSVATPQIIMRSGIGPKTHLKQNKIYCLLDLPVGKNLQDHVFFPLFLKTNKKNPVPSEMITLLLLQYMLTKSGPFAHAGIVDFMSFIDTKNVDYPDIQFHHTFFPVKDHFTLKSYLRILNFKEDIIEAISKLNEDSDLLAVYPTLLHPKSRGEILLADNNPESNPVIKTNYFQHPDDINTLLKAIDCVQKLEKTAAFKDFEIQLVRLDIEDCLFKSQTYWECYIRHMATTVYHPVGTTKMGTKSDKTSVVDHNLLVHGIQKLRVVDASVMPTIPGANIMASTLVISDKAVDIIKRHYEHKDDL